MEDQSSQKTIKITPSFFSAGKKGKSKTIKKKQQITKANHQMNTNKLKKKLIQHIRDLKSKKDSDKERGETNRENENTIDFSSGSNNSESNDFRTSLDFMKSMLSSSSPSSPSHSSNADNSPKSMIHKQNMHKEGRQSPTIKRESLSSLHSSTVSPDDSIIEAGHSSTHRPINLSMKTDFSNKLRESSFNIVTKQDESHNHSSIQPPETNPEFRTHSQNVTKKLKVGKIKAKKKVVIVLKNKTMKNKTEEKLRKYDEQDIQEIRKYLQEKGFIKYGCSAPNEILREMYKNLKMSGKVKNLNMKNYISEVTNI